MTKILAFIGLGLLIAVGVAKALGGLAQLIPGLNIISNLAWILLPLSLWLLLFGATGQFIIASITTAIVTILITTGVF